MGITKKNKIREKNQINSASLPLNLSEIHHFHVCDAGSMTLILILISKRRIFPICSNNFDIFLSEYLNMMNVYIFIVDLALAKLFHPDSELCRI